VPARLIARGERQAAVIFAAGEYGVSPGQACVFYDDGEEARVLGGGFIAAVEPASPAAILDHKPRAASAGWGAGLTLSSKDSRKTPSMIRESIKGGASCARRNRRQ